MNMKKIYYIIVFAVLVCFSACQKPDFVEPTTERQGITSLEAYFTFGKFVDQLMARYVIEDENTDYYEIPIPWYYPEESEDATLIYMTAVRVRAELAYDCSIYPPLSVLDLTQENKFIYTNADGESRQIIITGKRTKSSKCDLQSFKLTEPYALEGFVNNETREIYLFSVDDLSNYSAKAVPCAHATIKEDLSVPRNYNEPQVVTVVAHDGVTEAKYTITKRVPTKIPYGFNDKSIKQLFNFEPVSRIGFPAYTEMVYPSMAFSDGHLVVSLGNGTVPVYLNGQTGEKLGQINLGSAVADGITSDDAGNILIANYAEGGGVINIYKTASVTEAPVLLYSYTNPTDVPAGHNIRVIGDVNSSASIVLTHEGIIGVTESSRFSYLTVSGGTVVASEVVDMSGAGISWAAAPTNAAKVVPVSTNPADGVIETHYSQNTLNYFKGNKLAAQSEMTANGNYNSNCLDTKHFNNATYCAYLITSHFPMWGIGPILSIYDIASPATIADLKPVMTTGSSIEWYQQAAAGVAAGDVVIGVAPDGFKMFIYYFDHNCGVIGGFSADCVQL